jgi:hypothetical protein
MSFIPKLTCKEKSDGFHISLETDCEDRRCTQLHTCIFGTWRTFTWDDYFLIKPKKYLSASPDYPDVESYIDRKYGFAFFDGSDRGEGPDCIFLYYGISDNTLYNELREQMILLNFPWKGTRLKSHRLLDLNSNNVLSVTEDYKEIVQWDEQFRYKEADQPCAFYKLVDKHDGQKIKATVRVEEMRWSRGEKWMSWLKYFKSDIVVRRLEIEFDNGVGPSKDSWKGGTTFHSFPMLPDENVDSAMIRYCKNPKNSVVLGIY